jgi:hypothetical protein
MRERSVGRVPDPRFGILELRIEGFRSARDVTLRPAPLCALVGEARAGKSNVLEAIWTLLEPGAPGPGSRDAFVGGDGRIRIEAHLGRGQMVSLEAAPPEVSTAGTEVAPPILFLPATARSGPVIAPTAAITGPAADAAALLRATIARNHTPRSTAAGAVALASWLETCTAKRIRGLVLVIEEPELFLRPQAQRYLYRLLRSFAFAGNQVIYSTHAPAFLNVGRIEELALVEQRGEQGTTIVQPQPLAPDEAFRALSEFDAERSELFLSRATLLVEGRTEKLVFPFVFQALGYDHDREGISIVECGGKPNIPLFARICKATGVPFVVVHDRDASAGREPIVAERAVNAAIAAVTAPEDLFVLERDFEAVAGLAGHSHKPERAWESFATLEQAEVPALLQEAASRVLAYARGRA